MAVITRGTKASAGGGTAFVTATTILPGEVNTDFDTIYTEYNSTVGGGIAATTVDDISATSATHDDTATPGDSSSHTLPTSLEGELEQLRYTVERLALGVGADRVDGSGTGTTFWGDLPARGHNLVNNPNFSQGVASGSTPPTGWTDIGTGTPTFSQVALTGATLSEGQGYELRIQAGSAAVAGVRQTINGKANTRYLVVARARITTNAAHLTTTGADATSSFRNIDDTTTSTSYVTLKGVVQTDSTPTNINVQLTTNGASGDDVRFAFMGIYECGADFVPLGQSSTQQITTTSAITLDNTTYTSILSGAETIVPGRGYEIHVDVMVPIANTNASVQTVAVRLTQGGSGVAGACWEQTMPASSTALAIIKNVRIVPSIAAAFVWAVDGRSTAAANVTTNGTSLVTGTPTRTAVLNVRLVKVSG